MKLRIDAVTVPGGSGRIGICACPGGHSLYSNTDAGSLGDDLDSIRGWGASGVITLVEQEEIEILGIGSIGDECRRRGMWWLHMPVRDMCAPDASFDARWTEESTRLRALLHIDESFVIHCWAGLGRAGTVAARLLTDCGVSAQRAVALVREARPGAIQSLQQEIYVQRHGP